MCFTSACDNVQNMLITEIRNENTLSTDERTLVGLLDRSGVVTRFVAPSSMSFLTSMRIATDCKHHSPDAIIVHRLKDAIGAISARDLAGKSDKRSRLLFMVDPGESVPKKIPTGILNEIDCWIFPNKIIRKRYESLEGSKFKSETILYPTTTASPFERPSRPDDGNTINFLRLGEPDETETIRTVVTLMEKLGEDNPYRLRVLSTGRARDVMPVVRRAQANKLPVEWLGDTFDLNAEIARADAILLTRPDSLTALELRALASGLPLIANEEQLRQMSTPNGREELIEEARQTWNTLHHPDIYIAHFKQLINP